jgi:hypothetical protein
VATRNHIDFTTTDLALATFLVTRGHPLERLDRDTRRVPSFTFGPDARADAGTVFEQALVPVRPFVEIWARLEMMSRHKAGSSGRS